MVYWSTSEKEKIVPFGKLPVNRCFEHYDRWYVKIDAEYLGMGDVSPNCFCYNDSTLLHLHELEEVTQIGLKIEEI